MHIVPLASNFSTYKWPSCVLKHIDMVAFSNAQIKGRGVAPPQTWIHQKRPFWLFLTFLAVKVNFFHPSSLMFLLSILFSSKMVLVPLDSWRFISVVDTGSSEWYANTTLVAPTYNKRAMQIKGRYTRGILHSPGARPGSKAPPCVPTISWVFFILGKRISTPQNAPRYLTG